MAWDWVRALTIRLRQQAAPSASQEFERMMNNSRDVIMRLSGDVRLTYVSPAAMQVFGQPPSAMLGKSLRYFAVPEDVADLVEHGQLLYEGKVDVDSVTFRVNRPDGLPAWVEVNTRREFDLYGEPTGDFVIVARDVTVQKTLQNKFENLAMTDGLTGLGNRRAFDAALERAWRGAIRHKRQLSLLLLDVDFFKKFNDSYGHQVGDQCLCAIANAVSASAMRPADMVARYGGEEIAVILEETDGPGALDVAHRVLACVRDLKIPHLQNPAGDGFVTVSVGVATAAMVISAVADETSLVAAADRALYEAKGAGRNRAASALLMGTPDV